MRLIPPVSAALILLLSGPSFAQGYKEYASRTDFFIVALPGDPTIQETTHTSEYAGVFPARVYSVVNDRSRFNPPLEREH